MIPVVSIVLAGAADASAIAEIHVASWRDAYAQILDAEFLDGPIEADRFQLWAQRLGEAPTDQVIFVAKAQDGNAVGFVCVQIARDHTWGSCIDNLHVIPALRGRNIGKQLLSAAATEIERSAPDSGLHLWVFEANAGALRFYQRLGGRVVERSVSQIPSARGATILRVHWPEASCLRTA